MGSEVRWRRRRTITGDNICYVALNIREDRRMRDLESAILRRNQGYRKEIIIVESLNTTC